MYIGFRIQNSLPQLTLRWRLHLFVRVFLCWCFGQTGFG